MLWDSYDESGNLIIEAIASFLKGKYYFICYIRPQHDILFPLKLSSIWRLEEKRYKLQWTWTDMWIVIWGDRVRPKFNHNNPKLNVCITSNDCVHTCKRANFLERPIFSFLRKFALIHVAENAWLCHDVDACLTCSC